MFKLTLDLLFPVSRFASEIRFHCLNVLLVYSVFVWVCLIYRADIVILTLEPFFQLLLTIDPFFPILLVSQLKEAIILDFDIIFFISLVLMYPFFGLTFLKISVSGVITSEWSWLNKVYYNLIRGFFFSLGLWWYCGCFQVVMCMVTCCEQIKIFRFVGNVLEYYTLYFVGFFLFSMFLQSFFLWFRFHCMQRLHDFLLLAFVLIVFILFTWINLEVLFCVLLFYVGNKMLNVETLWKPRGLLYLRRML